MGYQSEYGLEENVLFIDASQSFENDRSKNKRSRTRNRRLLKRIKSGET
ncbi:hypothetical protein K4U89_11030 [Staphylococcus epidermidis]|nr:MULTISPECIES: hypothetical protein [Staphylococcus]MDU4701156.1 hypothetical protein [Staphylococcus warneri]MDU6032238.1 hypothetical protein [Peptoniphilus harei]HAR4254521.1 hypothetical protein [Staphylococcus aureus]EID36724.1 hypothetical protein ISK_0296 [Staphylococcus epidermidis IS-K]MBM6075841.1 hypothetical protein [Staphylococcus epidermidis]